MLIEEGSSIDGTINLGAGDDLLALERPDVDTILVINSLDGGEGTDRVDLVFENGAPFVFPVVALDFVNIEEAVQLGDATVALTGTNADYDFNYLLRIGELN